MTIFDDDDQTEMWQTREQQEVSIWHPGNIKAGDLLLLFAFFLFVFCVFFSFFSLVFFLFCVCGVTPRVFF